MVFAVGAAASGGLPFSFVLVYAVGFIAAVTIGSVAWYNSKRPAGWEDKDKPDFMPSVKTEDEKSGDA
ncbi:MAG: photosystem II assembly protein Psb35 [Nodosilinea sp.]